MGFRLSWCSILLHYVGPPWAGCRTYAAATKAAASAPLAHVLVPAALDVSLAVQCPLCRHAKLAVLQGQQAAPATSGWAGRGAGQKLGSGS